MTVAYTAAVFWHFHGFPDTRPAEVAAIDTGEETVLISASATGTVSIEAMVVVRVKAAAPS